MRVVHRKIPVPIGICTRPKNFQSVIARCTTRQRRAPWQARDVHPSAASQRRSSIGYNVPRLPRSSPLSRRRPRNDESMRYARGSSKNPTSHRNLQTAKEPPSRHCEVHDATASCAAATQGRSSIRDNVPRLPRSSPLSRRRPRNDESMRYARGSSKNPSSRWHLHTAPRTSKASLRGARRDSVVRRGKPGTFVHPWQARDVHLSAAIQGRSSIRDSVPGLPRSSPLFASKTSQ